MKTASLRMISAAAFLLCAGLTSAYPEEPVMAASNIRACFVDLQEVLRNYPEYAKAKETLEEWAKPKQKMISEKEREIQKMDNDLKKNLLRSEDAKKEKENEFKKELTGYQDMVKQLQSELADKEDDLLTPVKETLSKSIEDISKSKGYNVVFDAASPSGRPILYVDDALDITSDVIEKVKSKAEKADKKEKSSQDKK